MSRAGPAARGRDVALRAAMVGRVPQAAQPSPLLLPRDLNPDPFSWTPALLPHRGRPDRPQGVPGHTHSRKRKVLKSPPHRSAFLMDGPALQAKMDGRDSKSSKWQHLLSNIGEEHEDLLQQLKDSVVSAPQGAS